MRTLLAVLALLALSPEGRACSCFPPEVRAKTAQDALQQARLVVYGRIVEVDANGKARIQVLESFKGAPVGSVVESTRETGQCASTPFQAKDEALIISFTDTVTACDKHPPEHYLLEEFRANAGKKK